MVQKKLQKSSKYDALDLDGDGVVSDTELAALEAVEKAEKMDAQRRMAWTALIGIFVFGAVLLVMPENKIKALGELFGLGVIALAGVCGAYMGASAWMSRK